MKSIKQWFSDLIGMDEDEDNEAEAEDVVASEPPVGKNERNNNHIFSTAAEAPLSSQSMPINIYEPISFKECLEIADKLKKHEIVIVNYNTIPPSEAVRLYLYIKGCIYALDGSVEALSQNVFLYVPSDVGLQKPERKVPGIYDTLHFNWSEDEE